ncbi:MAG: TRAP transporter small permease [Alphaproteobacteria bacterium]
MWFLGALINVLVVVLLTAVVVLVTLEVALRYLFLESLVIADELSRYLMIWVAFLGAALCVRDDLHVRILVLVAMLRGRARRAIETIAGLGSCAFLAVLLYEGARILPSVRDQDTTTLGVSIMWFYLAMPVGSALMLVFLAAAIVRGRRPAAGEAEHGPGI